MKVQALLRAATWQFTCHW